MDTELYFNPNMFTGSARWGPTISIRRSTGSLSIRDPGRINLNTIYDQGYLGAGSWLATRDPGWAELREQSSRLRRRITRYPGT